MDRRSGRAVGLPMRSYIVDHLDALEVLHELGEVLEIAPEVVEFLRRAIDGERLFDVDAALEVLASNLSIELAHGYLKPIQVDENVGLLAVVGEGMRGTPGLAGRVFTAISRERINIIAIAQGSSEITIGIVVGLDGLERAVRAVHQECHLGSPHLAATLT